MATVKFKQKAIPVEIDGEEKWIPAIKLGDRDFSPMSHQGNIIIKDTKAEAEEYFDE